MTLFKTTMLAAALLAGTGAAHAATGTANFGVQLTVQNQCTFTSDTDVDAMDFGGVTGNISGNLDAATDLTVNCNNGAVYHIGLSDGLHAVAAGGQRRLHNGTQYVNYELSATQGGARWGATAAGPTGTSVDVDGTGTNTNQIVTVYGRVPAQSVGAGTYSDTITATIEF